MNDLTLLPCKDVSPEYLQFCEWVRRAAAGLGPVTQPTTTEEKARVREFQLQSGDYPHLQIEPIDDGPNPGEMGIDWLSINKEFS